MSEGSCSTTSSRASTPSCDQSNWTQNYEQEERVFTYHLSQEIINKIIKFVALEPYKFTRRRLLVKLARTHSSCRHEAEKRLREVLTFHVPKHVAASDRREFRGDCPDRLDYTRPGQALDPDKVRAVALDPAGRYPTQGTTVELIPFNKELLTEITPVVPGLQILSLVAHRELPLDVSFFTDLACPRLRKIVLSGAFVCPKDDQGSLLPPVAKRLPFSLESLSLETDTPVCPQVLASLLLAPTLRKLVIGPHHRPFRRIIKTLESPASHLYTHLTSLSLLSHQFGTYATHDLLACLPSFQALTTLTLRTSGTLLELIDHLPSSLVKIVVTRGIGRVDPDAEALNNRITDVADLADWFWHHPSSLPNLAVVVHGTDDRGADSRYTWERQCRPAEEFPDELQVILEERGVMCLVRVFLGRLYGGDGTGNLVDVVA